jgi:hypothetical protein
MSDNQDSKTTIFQRKSRLPTPVIKTLKISYDPNGERYIRTTKEESPLIATDHLSGRP